MGSGSLRQISPEIEVWQMFDLYSENKRKSSSDCQIIRSAT